MISALPMVFISYSHDCSEHKERVLNLADRLCGDGVRSEIDQYVLSPPKGWPLWCESQIEAADFVLMVCTETYHRRVKGGEEPGTGLGVVWEARIIRQLIYDTGSVSGKFVPILFADGSPAHIPTPVKGSGWYVVDTELGYEELYRRLTGQPRVVRPELGPPRELATRNRQVRESNGQVSILSNSATSRIVTVIFDQAQKFGLDLAGSFLGPAWLPIKPLVEGLIGAFPSTIASKWKNSDEALLEALSQIDTHGEEVRRIGEALSAHGVTDEWARSMSELLEGLPDDTFQVFHNDSFAASDPSNARAVLENVLAFTRNQHEKRCTRIWVRSSELEYVDLLRVPDDFLPGYDLTPSGFAPNAVSQRHLPAGFLVWTFSLLNGGQRNAVVSRIELQVTAEGECPPGSHYDELKPILDPFDDQAKLGIGLRAYPLFRAKRFTYAPDEMDAFRVQLVFVLDGPARWQQLRPTIYWSDTTGDHISYAPELFLASHPSPQLHTALAKFGVKDVGRPS